MLFGLDVFGYAPFGQPQQIHSEFETWIEKCKRPEDIEINISPSESSWATPPASSDSWNDLPPHQDGGITPCEDQ